MIQSIFGIEDPKIILDDESEIIFYHSVVLKDEPDFLTLQQESIITGHREWIDLGEHWIFQIETFLWKYANPTTFYLELMDLLYNEVILYRRKDGSPFTNPEGEDALFRIDEVIPNYVRQTKYYDVLIVTFVSVDPITTPITTPDLSKKQLIYNTVELKNAYNATEEILFSQNVETEIP